MNRLYRKYWEILCWLGFHNRGPVGRYYSGDGPEHLVDTCNRCGQEFGFWDET